jgi:lysozyme
MKSSARFAAALVALLATVTALWWFLWVPNSRPGLRPGETYGIDVSNHQGPIDWTRVAADDIDVAYIKATEGRGFVDAQFAANWRAAAEAGIARGAYHFFTLCAPGAEQAQNFLRTAPPDVAALPPSVDLELAGNCSARPSREELYRELDAFLDQVEHAWGRKVVLYVGPEWEQDYPVYDRGDRPLWLKKFWARPTPDWMVWQLHGWARIDGINGGVDLDVVRRERLNVPAIRGQVRASRPAG